jgi:hypothetical protein
MGYAGGWRDAVWKTFREDTARAGRIPAPELLHGELDVDRAHTPGELGQVALVTTMH